MGVDQLQLLRLGHGAGDLARPGEDGVGGAEGSRVHQPGQEARRALEERRHGAGEGIRRQRVELLDCGQGHEPR